MSVTAPYPGDSARWGRRLVAVAVDWALCQAITVGLIGVPFGAGGVAAFVPLGVFALENILLVSTLGTTVGHRLLGLAVRRADGPVGAQGRAEGPGALPGIIRTALLCLFVPALITGSDGRGLHDRAAGTTIIRSR